MYQNNGVLGFKIIAATRQIDSNVHGFFKTIPNNVFKTTVDNGTFWCFYANDGRYQSKFVGFCGNAFGIFYFALAVDNIKLEHDVCHGHGNVMILFAWNKTRLLVLDIGLVRNSRDLCT